MDSERTIITGAAIGTVLLMGVLFSLYGRPAVLVLAADRGSGSELLDIIREEKPGLRGPAVIKIITSAQGPAETLLRLKWARCRGVKAVGLGAGVPTDAAVEEQMRQLTQDDVFTYDEE